MTTGKRKTYWYIEPKDGFTNESLMEYLSGVLGATNEMVTRGVLDNHGRRHNVVEVLYSVIAMAQSNIREFSLRFQVFNRREGSETIREWRFSDSRLYRGRHVRKARKDLAAHEKKRSTKPKRFPID